MPCFFPKKKGRSIAIAGQPLGGQFAADCVHDNMGRHGHIRERAETLNQNQTTGEEQLQHKVPNDVFVNPSELKEISVSEVLTHPLTTEAFH